MNFFGFKDKKGPVKIKNDISNNNNINTNNININAPKNPVHHEPRVEGVIGKSLTSTTNTKFTKDKRRMGQVLDTNTLHSNKRLSLENDQSEKKKRNRITCFNKKFRTYYYRKNANGRNYRL